MKLVSNSKKNNKLVQKKLQTQKLNIARYNNINFDIKTKQNPKQKKKDQKDKTNT